MQILRNKIKAVSSEDLSKFIMEVYTMYKRASKVNLREPKFSNVLTECYAKLTNNQSSEGGQNLDGAVRYCQQQIHGNRPPVGGAPSLVTNLSQQGPAVGPPHPGQPVPSTPTVSSLTPSSHSSPASSQESMPQTLQATQVSGVSRRGARTGTSTRKPRGRPPGSGIAPRLPRGMSVSTFMSYQTELLRHYSQQNAELSRQLAAQTTVSAQTSQQPSAPLTSQPSTTSPSVLKDRPSLSITPLKATSRSNPTKPPSVSSSINKQVPTTVPSSLSVSTSKKANPSYKPRKPQPPLPPSVAPSSTSMWNPVTQSFRQSSISIQPIPAIQSSSIIKPPTPEVSLQHKILSAKKLATAPTSSSVIKNPTLPSLPSSVLPQASSILPQSSISITPTPSPLTKQQPIQPSISITSSPITITPTPSVSIKPASLSVSTPISITPTTAMVPLPHSIEKTLIKKTQELPFHPSNELTVKQITKPKATYSPRAQPAAPRKEVVNSISIIPTTSKVEPPKSLPRPSTLQDEKSRLVNKISSIDSNVADTLRNFGSSITITAAGKKPPVVTQDDMTITPLKQPKTKNPKDISEVIVLD